MYGRVAEETIATTATTKTKTISGGDVGEGGETVDHGTTHDILSSGNERESVVGNSECSGDNIDEDTNNSRGDDKTDNCNNTIDNNSKCTNTSADNDLNNTSISTSEKSDNDTNDTNSPNSKTGETTQPRSPTKPPYQRSFSDTPCQLLSKFQLSLPLNTTTTTTKAVAMVTDHNNLSPSEPPSKPVPPKPRNKHSKLEYSLVYYFNFFWVENTI